MTPVFPLAHTVSAPALRRRETYDGNSAWFACTVCLPYHKLLARFQAADLPVSNIYAEYVHFADLNAP
jgi:hypothetical protein